MSFFKSLFSSKSVVEDATEAVISGVDKIWYTDEEKAERFERFLKLYEPFKRAQRLLALVFCIPYALCATLTFILSFWVDVSTQLDLLGGMFGVIVATIVGFYFGGGLLESRKAK